VRIGVIGYGYRLAHVTGLLRRREPSVSLAAVCDPRAAEIRASLGAEADGIRFCDTAEELLAMGGLDGVLVGTRCSLHARLAIQVMRAGLPLFLEKPVATTWEDLAALDAAGRQARAGVVVSFPLRGTAMVQLAREILESGRLGAVEHAQAVNNVPYGGIYYQGWYRDESETRGLFLQKATHDFDYIGYLLGLEPAQVCAMTSKRLFTGGRPAGLRCADCGERGTCLESAVLKRRDGRDVDGELCCFAVDTGNEDSGSALIRYATGMHVSYSQNFFARRGAAARGVRLLGYRGTLALDFYTGTVRVDMHHAARVETHDLGTSGAHFGGDEALVDNFVQVMRGQESRYPLEAGVGSALLCLCARESALTGTFQPVSRDRLRGV
jgi:predicted dehydrogenase